MLAVLIVIGLPQSEPIGTI